MLKRDYYRLRTTAYQYLNGLVSCCLNLRQLTEVYPNGNVAYTAHFGGVDSYWVVRW